MSLKNPTRIGDNYQAWVKELAEAKKIFDDANIKYWLDMGTILGAMRNNDLILWDNDIDFSTEITEVPKVFAVIPKFVERGYKVVVTDSEIYFNTADHISIGMAFYRIQGDKLWILWLEKYSKIPSLTRHFKRMAERLLYREFQHDLPQAETIVYKLIPRWAMWPVRHILITACRLLGSKQFAMTFPRRLIEKLDTVKLCGMDFSVPSPAEKWVKLVYGENWQIPDKSWRWDQVAALDYSFFDQKQRINYHIVSYAPSRATNHRIIQ